MLEEISIIHTAETDLLIEAETSLQRSTQLALIHS